MSSFLRSLMSYVWIVIAVAGIVPLVVWLVEIAKKGVAVDVWLVVALAVFLVAALIWGAQRGGRSGSAHVTNIITANNSNIYFGPPEE